MACSRVNFTLTFMAYTLVPNVRYLEGPCFDLGVRGRQCSGLSLISSAYLYRCLDENTTRTFLSHFTINAIKLKLLTNPMIKEYFERLEILTTPI
jgi:hypothetical protein